MTCISIYDKYASENEAKCSLSERLIINLDLIQAGKLGGGASIGEGLLLERIRYINYRSLEIDMEIDDRV